MSDLTVDVEAIHTATRHLRAAAAELGPEPALLRVAAGDFESPVASALAATNTDLGRQCAAVAEFVRALADAGDRAAAAIVDTDAALSAQPPGEGP